MSSIRFSSSLNWTIAFARASLPAMTSAKREQGAGPAGAHACRPPSARAPARRAPPAPTSSRTWCEPRRHHGDAEHQETELQQQGVGRQHRPPPSVHIAPIRRLTKSLLQRCQRARIALIAQPRSAGAGARRGLFLRTWRKTLKALFLAGAAVAALGIGTMSMAQQSPAPAAGRRPRPRQHSARRLDRPL